MVPAFLPNPQSQTITAVTPCRIVDTRAAGGALTAGTTRSFAVGGSTGFAAQGGNPVGCAIPSSATAVAVSIVAVSPAAGGFLTAWPAGTTKPLASVLNYVKGVTTNTGQTTQITAAGNPALSVFASAKANVVIDVYGYYEPQTHLIILANAQVWYGNATHVTSVTHTPGSGTYTLTFDRSLTGCNVLATSNGDQTVQATPNWGGNALTVTTYQLSGGSYTVADESFQVFIAC